MECRYCGAEGARMKIGPGIYFCSERCMDELYDKISQLLGFDASGSEVEEG